MPDHFTVFNRTARDEAEWGGYHNVEKLLKDAGAGTMTRLFWSGKTPVLCHLASDMVKFIYSPVRDTLLQRGS